MVAVYPTKTALLIDGGHLRAACYRREIDYTPSFVEAFARSCFDKSMQEMAHRIFYYDSFPYKGNVKKPISGEEMELDGNDAWFKDLAQRDLFAVRLGHMAFRGWKLKKEKHYRLDKNELIDDHFRPAFEQKGVDMRIGLDIASFAEQEVNRIILVSNDGDMIPAMKYGRIKGLQIRLIVIKNSKISSFKSLREHADYISHVPLPSQQEISEILLNR